MCVAGAKLGAVGWGIDDSLGNHGTLCGATIEMIYGTVVSFTENRSEVWPGQIKMNE